MEKETDKQGNTKYKYPKCPACGSENRHFEKMSEEAVKSGSAKEGFLIAYQHTNGIIADPQMEAILPLGSEIPAITVATDICVDCGCLYAPMVITGKAKKQLAQQAPKIFLPGREN